jgi:hypothetical protein
VRARQKRKEQQDHSHQLFLARWHAEMRDNDATPLWECIADAFDFSDPNLWRSNSLASLRPRLVIWMRRVVATLEENLDRTAKRHHPWGGNPEPAAAPKQRVARLATEARQGARDPGAARRRAACPASASRGVTGGG